MKTLTLNTMAILMSLVMVLSSCSKNNENISPTNDCNVQLISSLENINMEYGIDPSDERENDNEGSRLPKSVRVILADAKGGLTGGWVGAAVASLDEVLGGSVIPTDPNGDLVDQFPYAEITPQNPNNPYDNYGVGHNASLETMFQNLGLFSNKDGSLNYAKLLGFPWGGHEGSCPLSSGGTIYYPCNCGEFPWSIKSSDDLKGAVLVSKNTLYGLKKMKVISKTERDILLLYKKGIKKLANINSFYSYTESFENSIAADKSLGNDSQKTLLVFLSIAKHSKTYWANKKF